VYCASVTLRHVSHYVGLLLQVTTRNTTTDRYVDAPQGFSGTPAFYVMDLNVATGEVYTVFEESSAVRWVVAAEVFVQNGTSTALSENFVNQWLAFDWRKAGVSAVRADREEFSSGGLLQHAAAVTFSCVQVDSKRGLLYVCVGVKSGGIYDTEFLAGIPMAAPPASSAVNFTMIAGPFGTDIIDAGYSAAHDALVVSTYNISTGVAGLSSLTGGDGGGDEISCLRCCVRRCPTVLFCPLYSCDSNFFEAG
jgi:hypothetical protein